MAIERRKAMNMEGMPGATKVSTSFASTALFSHKSDCGRTTRSETSLTLWFRIRDWVRLA